MIRTNIYNILNSDSCSLIDLVKMNHIHKIKQYIEQEKNLNVVDEFQMTPLMWSIIHNNFDIFNILLQKHLDLTLKDSSGYTAEDWAKYYSRNTMLKILDQIKKNKNKKGKKND